ncbi:MAG: polysaccharide biosynthesis C-terminal domain-containing protein [Thermaurantiacus sp.]
MALGFLVGVQLARYLGVEQYGVYGYVMAVASLAATIALFGLQLLAVRETAFAVQRRDWAALNGFLRWSWRRAVLFALLMALAAGIWLMQSAPGSAMPIPLWGAAFVIATAMVALLGPMLRGLGQIVGGQSLDTVLVPGLQCLMLAGAMLALGSLNATGALAIGVASTAIAAIVGLAWLWVRVPQPARVAEPRTDGAQWHRAMLPMGATTVMRALDSQMPMLVLGATVMATDLGTFRVALASMLLLNFPYTLVSIVSPPLASRLVAAGDMPRVQRLAAVATVATLLPTIGIAALLYLLGVPLITFIFGAEYAGAWPILMLLAFAAIANSFFGVTPAVLFATGNERLVTTAFATGVVLLGLMLAVLVPRFGIEGAALAIAISILVREVMLWRFCRTAAAVDPAPWMAVRLLGAR